MSEEPWAEAEFGGARLGNRSRTRRAVVIAARCSQRPRGKVTEVFERSAEREGAFRFVENDDVDAKELMVAAHGAGARRCATSRFAYVPVDKTSLTLTDRSGDKGFGMVGTRKIKAHGLHVMNAICVTPDGVPQGVVAQDYWGRVRKPKTDKHELLRRGVADKETQRWLDAMEHVTETFAVHAPSTQPWFQIDREGDAAPVLRWACDGGHQVTVRACWNRRLRTEKDCREYLRDPLDASPALGRYRVEIAGAPTRQARSAIMEIRSTRVALDLPQPRSNARRAPVDIFAVLAREVSVVPPNEAPLEWILLTTCEVDSFERACEVVYGYTQRWRIEEFHRAWKSGACRVEDNQLRETDHVIRWAVILASVALRIVRITYLARACPEQPADSEFSDIEIKVIQTLANPNPDTSPPTLKALVTSLATLGGYTGRSSGGPPGPLVLARGLARIQSAVDLLKAMAKT